MLPLYYIEHYRINTKQFTNLLHDQIVQDFEKQFASFVGAKHACATNSATNAIFLSMLNKGVTVSLPSIIPPVVPNTIINSGNKVHFTDNVEWVGDSYILHDFGQYKIIDSAHKVKANQFRSEANPQDLMIFSFYPTKMIGAPDGGIIVSDDEDKITWFKKAVMNGAVLHTKSWDRKIEFCGWKMYMNSIQAYFAQKGLKKLHAKTKKITQIRDAYNQLLGIQNSSLYLYRIEVKNNLKFVDQMRKTKIECGIHYVAAHKNPIYGETSKLPMSEYVERTTVSLPFNCKLTTENIKYIASKIHESKQMVRQ